MLLTFAKMNVKRKKIITYWLFSGLTIVLFMIIVGGITRVTDSGLSMVTWEILGKLFSEEDMKESHLDWEEAFERKISFESYKKIYFWENFHRQTGRFLGLLFIIPFIFFIINKWIIKKEIKKYIILLFLGTLVAAFGIFMVNSGIENNPNYTKVVSKVSHFWLATHFITALTLVCYIFWIILDLNYDPTGNKIIYKLSKWFLVILIIQLIYGSFTAGLRAGALTDPQSTLNTVFGYFNTEGKRNFDFLNNPFNIQFLHRFLAWGIALFSLHIWRKTRKTKLQKTGNLFLCIVILQITLGVATILTRVHEYLAVAHQFVASILLLITIYLIHQSQTNEKN